MSSNVEFAHDSDTSSEDEEGGLAKNPTVEEKYYPPSDEEDEEEYPEDNPLSNYIPEPNALDLSNYQNGKFWKEILTQGEGEFSPEPGMKVKFHYKGEVLESGKIFENTYDYGAPLEFILTTEGNIIYVLAIGLSTMKKGEKAVFVAHPCYAFGQRNTPLVPGNSAVKLEVELFDWIDDLSPNPFHTTIRNRIVVPANAYDGAGPYSPKYGAFYKAEIEGSCNGRVFYDKRILESFIGCGALVGLPASVERTLKFFVIGEKSKLFLDSQAVFNKKESLEMNIPPNSKLEYEMTLFEFKNRPEDSLEEMALEERVSFCSKLVKVAKDLFKKTLFQLSIEQFRLINKLLERESIHLKFIPAELDTQIDDLLFQSHIGLAKCLLEKINANSPKEATELIEQVMNSQLQQNQTIGDIVEALLLQSQAFLDISLPDEALESLIKAKSLDPNNTEIQNRERSCMNRKMKILKEEGDLAAKMLNLQY